MDSHATPLYNLWQTKRRLRRRLIIVLVVIVGLCLWLRPYIFQTKPATQNAASSSSNQSTNAITKASPDFIALTPKGESVEWSRLTPPNSAAFYVYTTTLSGVPIRVSEQPLPSGLQTDSQIAELAKNYNANRSITVDGASVYIGNSVKGQQSIIFSKHSLLILITSNAVLNDQQWSKYISSLQ